MQTKVSIQGYEGSFHQEAARTFFGKQVEVIPCATFREVVKIAGNKKESDGAVMAIENSIAGSILPNYNLLQKSNLRITGEVYLQIKQNLLVNPGVKLEDIREVHSHTMALQQCYEFLDKYKWKLVETEDTALSAKHIHQHKSKHIAAIASKLAAELFQLDMIAPSIQTMKNNYTRFLVLQREDMAAPVTDADKASVNFHTDHSKGSLAKVLTKIAEGGINLSKLQSFPIPGSDFKYSFHADMEFDSAEQFNQVIEAIRPLTAELKVYGLYKNGNKSETKNK
ncbi:MAG: prephenate dehydratase [Sphingobacteriales bacterium]|jgi:prephenate dehydratase|nr:prephenate dehydratase [Sphingobacteriales bacterium]OJW03269.1 MAG: chorismate mutase [Sphingobacteriales bacterium 44-61]